MIRHLSHYWTAWRFHRLFVKPFAKRIAQARKGHARGAREAQAAQRRFLHEALRR